MSRVRGKDTKPELEVRKGLHSKGYRFRLHREDLPGRPDIVFQKYQAVILVHGCFWHGHDCHRFQWPKSRVAWWRAKIEGNRARDNRNLIALLAGGWRVLEIWECALMGKMRLPRDIVLERAVCWLESANEHAEIKGSEGQRQYCFRSDSNYSVTRAP